MSSHRETCLHQARVFLAQARAFGERRSPFAFTLLEWAGNARRRATQEVGKPADNQLELFE